jgi:hypothetical protein
MKIYEPGMRIVFNQASGKVFVCFRGRRHELPETFDDDASARYAGETFCRRLGWRDAIPAPAARSLLRHRRSTAPGLV